MLALLFVKGYNNNSKSIVWNRQPAEDWQTFIGVHTGRLRATDCAGGRARAAQVPLRIWEGIRRARWRIEHWRLGEWMHGGQVAHFERWRRGASVVLNVTVQAAAGLMGKSALGLRDDGGKKSLKILIWESERVQTGWTGSEGAGGRWGRAGCRVVNQHGLVDAGEAGKAQAVMQLRSFPLSQEWVWWLRLSQHTTEPRLSVIRCSSALICIVNEVAAGAVRAETDSVECATGLSLVLRVAGQVSQFVVAVSKLTLFSILAWAIFLKRSAKFSFVAGRVDLRAGLLLKDFLKLLTAFTWVTERAVSVLVFFIHEGRCWALKTNLKPVAHVEVHVVSWVTPEITKRPVAVGISIGIGSSKWDPNIPLFQHILQKDCIWIRDFFLKETKQ